MSWRHWTAVLVVIGAGILLQIPRHDEAPMPAHDDVAEAPSVSSSESADAGSAHRTVSREVAGMTCATCPIAARVAVSRVAGVKEASFSWPEGIGSVTYDTTLTSPAEFIAELAHATGFEATLRPE